MLNHPSQFPWLKEVMSSHEIQEHIKCAYANKQSFLCYLIENKYADENILQQRIANYLSCETANHLNNIDTFEHAYIKLCLDNAIIITKQHEQHEQHICYLIEPLNKVLLTKIQTMFSNITFVVARYQDLIPKLYDLITTYIANTLDNSTYNIPEIIPLYLQCMLSHAIWLKASDIHIESQEKCTSIRFREDGILRFWATIKHTYATQLCNQIKLMASMNIAESRMPQDGRMKFHTSYCGEKDIRISSCPTIHNEKIVLRLLKSHTQNKQLNELGLSKPQCDELLSILEKRQGLILVSGPTGSGKTITLYSALEHLNNGELNICTAENPVEIDIPGINQVQVNYAIGLNFPKILRCFLRQDPDVIMIGEIRDYETAQIALHASQTGHLVLATLHSNHALGCIERLKLMELPTFELIASIKCIIAQRLVRRLCPYCKTPDKVTQSYHAYLQKIKLPIEENTPIYQAQQCQRCNGGYQGRIALFDIITLTDQQEKQQKQKKHIFDTTYSIDPLENFYQAAIYCIKQGETSVDEAIRIVRSL